MFISFCHSDSRLVNGRNAHCIDQIKKGIVSGFNIANNAFAF